MLCEPARVVATVGDRVQLQTTRGTACAKCAAGVGCGQYLPGGQHDTIWLRPGHDAVLAPGTGLLVPGRQLALSMEASPLLRLALLFYLLPLCALLTSTLLAGLLTDSELWLAVAAGCGLCAGMLVLRVTLRQWPWRRGLIPMLTPAATLAGEAVLLPSESPHET